MTQITLFVKTFSRFFFSSIFDIFLKIGLTCLPKKINQTSIINSSIPKFPNTQIKTKSRSISPIIFMFLFEGPVGFNCSVCCLKLGTVAGIRLSGHFVSACLNRTYHVYLITFHNYSGQFNQSLPEWPSENDFCGQVFDVRISRLLSTGSSAIQGIWATVCDTWGDRETYADEGFFFNIYLSIFDTGYFCRLVVRKNQRMQGAGIRPLFPLSSNPNITLVLEKVSKQ